MTTPRILLFPALLLATLLGTAACPGSLDDPASWTIDPDAATTLDGSGTCPDIPTVLAHTCTNPGCHTTADHYLGLDFEAPGVAGRLAGTCATQGPGLLIDPMNPTKSILYEKLTDTPPFGQRMPSGQTPLPDATIACVASWIAALTAPETCDGGDGGGGDGGVTDSAANPDTGPQMDGTVAFSPIRVAAGLTSDVMDSHMNTWTKDTGYTGGSVTMNSPAVAIARTDSPMLYNAERYGASGGNPASFSYKFPVPNGAYTVTLGFAEPFVTGAGLRQFNIAINSMTVATNFDIFAAAGGMNVAVNLNQPVQVTTGEIDIVFSPGAAQSPKVDAILIVAGSAAADASF